MLPVSHSFFRSPISSSIIIITQTGHPTNPGNRKKRISSRDSERAPDNLIAEDRFQELKRFINASENFCPFIPHVSTKLSPFFFLHSSVSFHKKGFVGLNRTALK